MLLSAKKRAYFCKSIGVRGRFDSPDSRGGIKQTSANKYFMDIWSSLILLIIASHQSSLQRNVLAWQKIRVPKERSDWCFGSVPTTVDPDTFAKTS